ncbi:MAG: hypothetical protein FWH37_10070 [Candidatus Bathyarchaeota archaeon]|nr:hypothetical protein [Candidatus Termiticorpusculum sp.]
MENVWGELKKIETQALQISVDAQNKAKQMVAASKQDAQKLVEDNRVKAEAEAQQLYDQAIAKANKEREEQIIANQAEIKKLKADAEKHMDSSVDLIVKIMLEEK